MVQYIKNKSRKIGVYVAHDDDSILGVGGKIVQHLRDGDNVYIVIFTDGRNSHKAILGIESSPSVWEVKIKRKEEIKKALKILGVPKERLYFLGLTDGAGKIWQTEKTATSQLLEITNKEKPDLIYFHYPDDHTDHRAVSKIILEILSDLMPKPKAYQFFIWTKESAKDRLKADASQFLEIPPDVLRVDIQGELDTKRMALFAMRSQVGVWPYWDWQIQDTPILRKKFLDYFLRGDEIFVKV